MSTRTVRVGNVCIGGDAPMVVQSMTNTKTTNITETVAQIRALYNSGADLVRVAVPDYAAAEAFEKIVSMIKQPLIADIHFDYKLAIAALEAGAKKVRINPGNIGSWDKVNAIICKAKMVGAAIRIGVNAGSLDRKILQKYGGPSAEAMVESALEYERHFLANDFNQIVLSLKSSDVKEMVKANRLISKQSKSPLHLGVTEAGTPFTGTIKSAIGIGSLLLDGIGDTFRVSLTADPIEEIRVANKICSLLGFSAKGITIISCPTCGRTESDLISLVTEFEERTSHIKKPVKVAIMGCVVNGPGEAREADIGLALGKGKAVVFRRGQPVKTVTEGDFLEALLQEVENYSNG